MTVAKILSANENGPWPWIKESEVISTLIDYGNRSIRPHFGRRARVFGDHPVERPVWNGQINPGEQGAMGEICLSNGQQLHGPKKQLSGEVHTCQSR